VLEIVQIPVLSDNYVYLLHDAGGACAVVDPAESEPVLAALAQRGWTLDWILNTHHHWDHVGANLALKQVTGCRVIGFRSDARRIPGIDEMVAGGDIFRLGESPVRVIEVPGHTLGHVAYWFERDAALFCGDTLFALGCGRLFEGTAEQMWDSLCKLRLLPEQTRVCCAHEYTLKNARFALTIEPDYPPLLERVRRIEALRAEGKPTVPSRLGEEKATNPFLRADDPQIQIRLGMVGAPAVAVFAELRRRRDRF